MMTDKVLIIGATGLLGTAAYELASSYYETSGTYMSSDFEGKKNGFWKLDVTNRDQVMDMFNAIRPDFVFDTHALTNVDYCQEHRQQAYDINVDGSHNVMDAAKSVGARVAFISSDYVFDGKQSIYTEESEISPLNVYGLTKAEIEDMFKDSAMIARTSSIYGLGSSTGKKSFIPWLIDEVGYQHFATSKKVEIMSDLYYTPTYNMDLANAIFSMYHRKAPNGIYNVAGPECMTKFDFAERICREFGLESTQLKPVLSTSLHMKAVRPVKVKLSMYKMRDFAKVPRSLDIGLKDLHSRMI